MTDRDRFGHGRGKESAKYKTSCCAFSYVCLCRNADGCIGLYVYAEMQMDVLACPENLRAPDEEKKALLLARDGGGQAADEVRLAAPGI
jgi:hypothetical protein